ncbi:hypothetical protein BUALT_Bualt12G0055300 [Buddleja alternifolia]|uniref:F-box associated domain-containing protein n=1 Tax=Buddleja alternifolia TaxID=168488 RepID=A0AAV6WWY2_9LAMI|nr:hypothetical protein BUALT_Bualt12G0055300 [Buddleja alternifolia]
MQYRNLMIRRPFCGLCLAFDPMKSPHYKVICFVSKREERLTPFAIDVYESETHKWKHLGQHDIDIMYYWQIHDGVYWNGRMYFIRPGGRNSFCFDVEKLPNYVVQWIDKPPRVCSRNATIKNYAMESNGHLHSMTTSLRPDTKCLSIFELNNMILVALPRPRIVGAWNLEPDQSELYKCLFPSLEIEAKQPAMRSNPINGLIPVKPSARNRKLPPTLPFVSP